MELSANPLILTLILSGLLDEPPRTEAEIYEQIIEIILGAKNQETRNAKYILQNIALNLVAKEIEDFLPNEIFDDLKNEIILAQQIEPMSFIQKNIDKGLLVKTEDNKYKFVHPIIRDYLAASQIKESGQKEIITNKIHKLEWSEFIRIYLFLRRLI